MKTKHVQWLMIVGLAVFSFPVKAQSTLDAYIQQALDSNAVLQQRSVKYEQALTALKTARSNYLPTVNFAGSYVTAQGGRYAELPLGQMLNPVYSSLNQLTGSNAFPQISDQQINFLPTNFYDAYIRTAVPVLNLDIHYNKQIQEQKAAISELELTIYARELVKDVKVAYFNYQAALRSVEIYRSNLVLLDKNVALNEALLREGKGLKASLLRAQSEVMKMNASITAAENQVENARAYFNFLLNRPLETAVAAEDPTEVLAAQTTIAQTREELLLLQQVAGVQQTVLTMSQRFWVPKVNAFIDFGSQGTDWEVSRKSAYYMFGVSTSIPIYNGSRNKQQIHQAKLELTNTELQRSNTEQQLILAVQMAERNVRAARANWESAQQQQETAKAYYELVAGANREGLTNQLEFIDASSQVTQSGVFATIQYQQYLVSLAELERANASYPIRLN